MGNIVEASTMPQSVADHYSMIKRMYMVGLTKGFKIQLVEPKLVGDVWDLAYILPNPPIKELNV